jgi:hypothetical protein
MNDQKFNPIPNCAECGGTGWKLKKKSKESEKKKPCKLCVKASGFCPKCNNTGEKIGKPGKLCKCRKNKEIKSEETKSESKEVLSK